MTSTVIVYPSFISLFRLSVSLYLKERNINHGLLYKTFGVEPFVTFVSQARGFAGKPFISSVSTFREPVERRLHDYTNLHYD